MLSHEQPELHERPAEVTKLDLQVSVRLFASCWTCDVSGLAHTPPGGPGQYVAFVGFYTRW